MVCRWVLCIIVVLQPFGWVEANNRMSLNELTNHNFEVFLQELREDLPQGSSFQQVNQYLKGRNIRYRDLTQAKNMIYFVIRNVYSGFSHMSTDFHVRIFMREDNEVAEVLYIMGYSVE